MASSVFDLKERRYIKRCAAQTVVSNLMGRIEAHPIYRFVLIRSTFTTVQQRPVNCRPVSAPYIPSKLPPAEGPGLRFVPPSRAPRRRPALIIPPAECYLLSL